MAKVWEIVRQMPHGNGVRMWPAEGCITVACWKHILDAELKRLGTELRTGHRGPEERAYRLARLECANALGIPEES